MHVLIRPIGRFDTVVDFHYFSASNLEHDGSTIAKVAALELRAWLPADYICLPPGANIAGK
jgi:hypothetical protein